MYLYSTADWCGLSRNENPKFKKSPPYYDSLDQNDAGRQKDKKLENRIETNFRHCKICILFVEK